MGVKRVYVEKKPEFAVQAKELRHEVKSYLGIKTVKNVRVLIRYDVENLSDATFERACNGVFAEPPVDVLYREDFPREESDHIFSVEFLPGQFDQRADSAVQCVQFIKEDELPVIKTATTYVIEGEISEEEMEAIKAHCINPVDSRETGLEKPETLVTKFEEPADVKIFDGFKDMPEAELKELYSSLGLAMTFKDFQHIQNYFKGEEHRDPSMTEIRVLDTYWSDHCRHTTFSTELTEVSFGDGDYRKPMEDTYKEYLQTHSEIFKGREDKFVCLMDLALMAMRKLKKEGKLQDQEESDEINACSIVVPVEVDGVEEEWLVNFKNETHNHPTEIEPFGGAATCLGGAIRDPLSGRTYVYQAMRVTGAADPTVSVKETMKGKLPQKKLVRSAAHGYSSYGNQIGLATGHLYDYKTYEEFEAAYFNQIAFFVKYWAELSNIGAEVRAKNFSKLVKTVTTYDCVAKGKSLDAGGSRYNFGCVETVGFAAAADALYAIKKLVFEDKVLDAKVLDAAMAANFEGYDAVHRMVQNLPKFGNDVAEVDQLASRLLDHFWAECGKYVSFRGGVFLGACSLLQGGIQYGYSTWANADGRVCGEPLGNTIGPVSGRDVNGLTAMLNSVAALDLSRGLGGTTCNVRISKDITQGEEGRAAIVALIKTYLATGGMMAQITTANVDELRDAQEHPEKHEDLIVRVGGFSIRFNELDRTSQNEIILRYSD